MMKYECCFIVPVYNHHRFIEAMMNKLLHYKFPVFLVDDGSIKECADILLNLATKHDNVHLVRLSRNQGKGASVMTGLMKASAAGFTHGLQIDADGQHDDSDIPKFIEFSRAHPESLISGKPVFDNNIPNVRLYGRYITHFWVWIETLSFSIKDSMCGFRIYPIQECINLLKCRAIGKRMDFDTEIMVRLYWRGVPVHFIPTRVNYPADGVSHFNNITDNILITKMHIKLVFGMIIRIPVLLLQRLRK